MQKKKPFDIIGYGAVAVDDILYIEHYPESDTKVEVSHRERQGGGLIGTGLVAAARLGVKTAYFGSLGQDELSNFTREAFINEGVDITKVINKPDSKPIYSTIVTDQGTGERTIFYSLADFDSISLDDIPSEIFADAKYLMLDSYVLDKFPRLVYLASQYNTILVADVETVQVVDYRHEIGAIHILILSRKLGSKITGEVKPFRILEKLDSPKRQCSIITDGKNGCWFKIHSGQTFHLPAYPTDPIDTTGCGDVFHGAFTAGLVHRKSIEDAVKWGSGAASLKARHCGGRKGIPDLPTLLDFISSHPENLVEVVES